MDSSFVPPFSIKGESLKFYQDGYNHGFKDSKLQSLTPRRLSVKEIEFILKKFFNGMFRDSFYQEISKAIFDAQEGVEK